MLYYIPGGTSKVAAKNIMDKLEGRWDTQEPATRTVVSGPEGQGAGVICTVGNADRLAINLAEQSWYQSGDGSFWFGWWNDERPEPSSLIRKEVIPGDTVRGWLVPRVRKWHLFQESPVAVLDLPRKPRWNGTDYVRGAVVDRFEPVASLAEEIQTALVNTYFQGGDDGVVHLPDNAPKLASQVLMINHRVGPDELAALEAFEMSFDSIASILRVFVSWDQFEDLVRLRSSAVDPEKKTR